MGVRMHLLHQLVFGLRVDDVVSLGMVTYACSAQLAKTTHYTSNNQYLDSSSALLSQSGGICISGAFHCWPSLRRILVIWKLYFIHGIIIIINHKQPDQHNMNSYDLYNKMSSTYTMNETKIVKSEGDGI